MPRPSLAFVLTVEALCIAAYVGACAGGRGLLGASAADAFVGVLLVVVAVGVAEVTDRVDAFRRFLAMSSSGWSNSVSIWCFAAAVALPVPEAAMVAASVYGYNLLRARRRGLARYHRMAFSAATETLATMAAGVLVAIIGDGQSVTRVVGLLAAILAYGVVNQGLVVSVIVLTQRPERWREVILGPADQLNELAGLTLGALLGVSVVSTPLLILLVVPAMVVIRRAALVHELQQQATRDGKTGLLNATAWQQQAERQWERDFRSGRSGCVLMIDLDHFKDINDTHGHLAGDAILRAVASELNEALRPVDVVGRHGGEEFVAYLADIDPGEAGAIAERLRERIASVRLPFDVHVTASLGLCLSQPGVAEAMDELVRRADEAMYRAKQGGRNRVAVAEQPVVPLRAVADPLVTEAAGDHAGETVDLAG